MHLCLWLCICASSGLGPAISALSCCKGLWLCICAFGCAFVLVKAWTCACACVVGLDLCVVGLGLWNKGIGGGK